MTSLSDNQTEIDTIVMITSLWDLFPKSYKISLHSYIRGSKEDLAEEMLADIIKSLNLIDTDRLTKVTYLLDSFADQIE